MVLVGRGQLDPGARAHGQRCRRLLREVVRVGRKQRPELPGDVRGLRPGESEVAGPDLQDRAGMGSVAVAMAGVDVHEQQVVGDAVVAEHAARPVLHDSPDLRPRSTGLCKQLLV